MRGDIATNEEGGVPKRMSPKESKYHGKRKSTSCGCGGIDVGMKTNAPSAASAENQHHFELQLPLQPSCQPSSNQSGQRNHKYGFLEYPANIQRNGAVF